MAVAQWLLIIALAVLLIACGIVIGWQWNNTMRLDSQAIALKFRYCLAKYRWKFERAAERQAALGDGLGITFAQERFIAIMPESVLFVDAFDAVHYASRGARRFHIIDGRLKSGQLRDVTRKVVRDARTRDIEFPVTYPDHTQHMIHARVGSVGNQQVAILLSDVTEQRQFESMRRDFITNVSHELKTPTGAISLLAETIADAADDADAVRYFAKRIITESARLTELVGHLIDLQHVQYSHDAIGAQQLELLDLRKIAAAAIDQVCTLAEQHHNAIVVKTPEAAEGSSLQAYGNADSLVTALKNLVENAVHYSPEGSPISVAISLDAAAKQAIIRVVDHGVGIPRELQDRIFERFYRVDPARSRDTGGSGLGLAITKHCVERSGGKLTVWSRPRMGSTFSIILSTAAPAERGASANLDTPTALDTAADIPSHSDTSVTPTAPTT